MATRLVYDDDCGFCTWCARWAARLAPVELIGFSELSEEDQALLVEDYETCAHLITGRTVYSCGEAMEQTLARAHPAVGLLFGALRGVPGYPAFRERAYRWAADRRDWWGRLVSADPP